MKKILPVSLIIPTYNRCQDLQKCLVSLKKLSACPQEVIVVDDNSQDNTEKMIQNKFPEVIYLKNHTNSGPAKARNKGIKRAKGKYIWFLDSDIEIVSPFVLAEMVREMENDRKIRAIGGELLQVGSHWLLRVHHSYVNGDGHLKYLNPKTTKRLKVRFLPTSNLLTKKSILLKVGGFNEIYHFCFEDTELGEKINKLGLITLTGKNWSVKHFHSPTGRFSNFLTLQRNRIRFVVLNKPWPIVILLPLIDLLINLLLLPRRIKDIKIRSVFNYLPGKTNNNSGFFEKTTKLVGSYISALVLAYLWNIWFLPQTLKLRFSYPNYLK